MLLQLPHMQKMTHLNINLPLDVKLTKKLPEPGLNQRDHSNDNADPAHKNLDNKQRKISDLEKLFHPHISVFNVCRRTLGKDSKA